MIKSSKTLVSIRSDDHHKIALSHIEHDDFIPSLQMIIEDGGGSHIFSFADAFELRSFATRILETANTMID